MQNANILFRDYRIVHCCSSADVAEGNYDSCYDEHSYNEHN